MRRDEHDDDPVVEWALGERIGGEQPPDLVDRVRARLHAAPVAAPSARFSPSQLAAAALLLLGIAVVCGVALWPKRAADDAPAACQEPKPVEVTPTTDVAALPAGTKAVEASGIHDVKFAELARLRELEVLILRDPANESFGLSPKVARGREHYFLTAQIWPQIATYTKLRRLELSGIVGAMWFGVVPKGLEGGERVVGAFAQLERLPLLESLTLRCCDIPDEVLAALPRLRTLRHLDLSFNHGFGKKGMEAISKCLSLRSVSLRGCQQLLGTELAMLASLPELEEVDLSAIDGINWRAGSAEVDGIRDINTYGEMLREYRAINRRWRAHTDRSGTGPSNATIEALSQLPKLRVLNVSGGQYFTGDGLAALGRCASLRELNASGLQDETSEWVHSLPRGLERLEVCGKHGDDFCGAVAERLTSLRDLTLAACDRITDDGVRAIAAMPSLRRLDLRQMRGLSAATIDTLANATQLEELDLRHDEFVTAEHVVRLRKALPNLRVLQTSAEPK